MGVEVKSLKTIKIDEREKWGDQKSGETGKTRNWK